MIERFITSFIAKGGDFKNDLQVLIPMYAGIAGIDAINKMIQDKFINSSEVVKTEFKEFKKR
ncbi:MAG: hypothetical protein L6U99_14945 [Clostridium sp.]|nr:MAG: hypothetical protein L6U99_14945 [Clostridium sp.]